MSQDNRRSFTGRSCLLGLCGIGASSGLVAADVASGAGQPKPESIHSRWITSLLLGLKDESQKTARRIIKNRGEAHFDDLNLKDKLAPYVGKLESFLSFLRDEWGWIVDFDRSAGIISADENKTGSSRTRQDRNPSAATRRSPQCAPPSSRRCSSCS